jgi:hypothetical protein
VERIVAGLLIRHLVELEAAAVWTRARRSVKAFRHSRSHDD